MTPDDIFTYAAMAIFVILPVIIIWPDLFPKDKPEPPRINPIQYSPPKPKPVKPPEKPKASLETLDKICRSAQLQQVAKRYTIPDINPETLKAMHKQADAERAIAEALEGKAQRTHDTIKRARLEKQAANSWVRFNKILDQIDKLTMQ